MPPAPGSLASAQDLQQFDGAPNATPQLIDRNPLIISVDAFELVWMGNFDRNKTVRDDSLLSKVVAVGESGDQHRDHGRVLVHIARQRLNRTHQLRLLRR